MSIYTVALKPGADATYGDKCAFLVSWRGHGWYSRRVMGAERIPWNVAAYLGLIPTANQQEFTNHLYLCTNEELDGLVTNKQNNEKVTRRGGITYVTFDIPEYRTILGGSP